MMRYGIPEYRMPYDALAKDIDYIESVGVEIQCNTQVGKDIMLDELRRDYGAVFVGIGLQGGRSTGIEGTDHQRVYQAIDLLRRITIGEEIDLTEKVIVIGGGNVAMDISRSIARLQKARYGRVDLTPLAGCRDEALPNAWLGGRMAGRTICGTARNLRTCVGPRWVSIAGLLLPATVLLLTVLWAAWMDSPVLG